MVERAGLGDGTTSALDKWEINYYKIWLTNWKVGELFHMLALLAGAS